MKKSIASMALLMSASSALAMPMPRDPNAPQPKLNTYCLSTYVHGDGSGSVSFCDESANNAQLNKAILANGCAADQVSIQTYSEVAINACMPPGVAQL